MKASLMKKLIKSGTYFCFLLLEILTFLLFSQANVKIGGNDKHNIVDDKYECELDSNLKFPKLYTSIKKYAIGKKLRSK